MNDNTQGPGSASHDQVVIQIVGTPLSGSLLVRLLGEVRSIWVHWKGGRSHACSGENHCPPDIHRQRTVWRGYVACEWADSKSGDRWVPAVLEVTEGLVQYVTDANPRGQVWKLSRFKINAERSECRGTFVSQSTDKNLRTDIDVDAAVKRLYRNLWVEFGKPLPFGFRQSLKATPVAAHAPAVVPEAEPSTQCAKPSNGKPVRLADLLPQVLNKR